MKAGFVMERTIALTSQTRLIVPQVYVNRVFFLNVFFINKIKMAKETCLRV